MTYLRLLGLGFLVLLLVACHGPPGHFGAHRRLSVAGDTGSGLLFLMPAGAEDVVSQAQNALGTMPSNSARACVVTASFWESTFLSFIARPLDISELFSLGPSLPHLLQRSEPATPPARSFRDGDRVGARAPLNRYGPYYYATASRRSALRLCRQDWQLKWHLPPHLRRRWNTASAVAATRGRISCCPAFEQGQVRPDTVVLPLGIFAASVRPCCKGSAGDAQLTAGC